MIMSSALLVNKIYVFTKFKFNPSCTFQDMARTTNHYEKNGYGEIAQ